MGCDRGDRWAATGGAVRVCGTGVRYGRGCRGFAEGGAEGLQRAGGRAPLAGCGVGSAGLGCVRAVVSGGGVRGGVPGPVRRVRAVVSGGLRGRSRGDGAGRRARRGTARDPGPGVRCVRSAHGAGSSGAAHPTAPPPRRSSTRLISQLVDAISGADAAAGQAADVRLLELVRLVRVVRVVRVARLVRVVRTGAVARRCAGCARSRCERRGLRAGPVGHDGATSVRAPAVPVHRVAVRFGPRGTSPGPAGRGAAGPWSGVARRARGGGAQPSTASASISMSSPAGRPT